MQRMVMLVTILKRCKSENILSFLIKNNISITLGRYGRGTATDDILNLLGLGEKEKCITFSTMPESTSKIILKSLEEEMNLKYLGEGLAFTIPISSIGGKIALKYMGGEFDGKECEESMLNGKDELIVVISNRGFVDEVMKAARKGGASGGTVMHARGTGTEQAEKFFGSNIGAEKEIIFIVSNGEKAKNIMKSIMDEAGTNTEAGSIAFSLPILDSAGIIQD